MKNSRNTDLYPEFLVEEINHSLRNFLQRYQKIPDILQKSMEYMVLNGGKRFRPVLCLLVAESMGGSYKKLIPTACAIEFVHTYSLIHDDLPSMDNDDIRRGKPSCHKAFGEDIAILTGDVLLTESFSLVLNYQEGDSDTKVRVIKEIIDAIGAYGMIAGQVIDVSFANKEMGAEELEDMDYNKTGKLIVASVRCGAILSKANDDYLEKFTRYAKNLGLAFQITDDILDANQDYIGVKSMEGRKEIKRNTYPNIFGMEKSKKIAKEKIEEAIDIVKGMDIDSTWLVNIAQFLLERKF